MYNCTVIPYFNLVGPLEIGLSPTVAGSAGRESRDFRRGKVGALVGKSKEHAYLHNIEHAPAQYGAGACTIWSAFVRNPNYFLSAFAMG